MSDVSLSELLDLSIGTPRPGAVNFTALHALLRAVLRRLGIREVKIRWSGDELPDAPMGVTGPGQDPDQDPERLQIEGDSPREVQPGSEPQRRVASSPGPPPSSSPAADGLSKLRSRIQTCEDGVSQAMTLIQTLHTQRDSLKVQINELHQHKMEGGTEPDMAAAVETCCRRVETLEETVRSLKDTVQKYPDDLSRCVTWDVMESALLSGGGDQQRLDESGVVDLLRSTDEPYNSNTSPIHPAEDSAGPPVSSEEVSAHQLTTETSLVLSGPPGKTHAGPGPVVSHLSRTGGGSERYLETVDALRTLSKLKEKFNHLETRVAALEEGKVDQTQLDQLRDTISNQGSQDVTGNLMDQLKEQRKLIDSLVEEREKSVDLMNDVQTAILQLQAECEKLHETTSQLHEDNRQKHSHIQELFKTTEELEEKKADKLMVENEIKADKSALDSKVSRLQFDSATEQLNTMFHQLQGQVTDQAQDWHKVMDKLSSEMECKLVRTELDTVKKQLEDCRKNIDEKLQTQGAAEHEDAAALRKQLVDRFHCLSCDRPVVKQTPGPHLMTLPSSPGFSSHRSIRPFTVYALEQFRQHYRSERVAELSDYSHLAVSRSCGGSHTVTSASQRRSGLQNTKHHSQPDGEGVVQSEEVDIVGLDGHIYRGRLNVPAVRTTETKLPAITTKDVTSGVCRTKDKAKCSLSHKPAASPEGGHAALGHHPLSMKSAQCSRSVSSCSGRDWPVSAMGCPSQSSQASAASVRPVGGDTELSDL
ncbi:uncharacterized protein C16orf96 [Echeneis naucrates]|uniref:uncharacterized protein C16orf96 n=1 Tax=Echeneis naucrates TaxID=173247 RepID=UPI00111442F5|nr:uncharacterized protein C16orf96-like [Echeneis naucrates]